MKFCSHVFQNGRKFSAGNAKIFFSIVLMKLEKPREDLIADKSTRMIYCWTSVFFFFIFFFYMTREWIKKTGVVVLIINFGRLEAINSFKMKKASTCFKQASYKLVQRVVRMERNIVYGWKFPFEQKVPPVIYKSTKGLQTTHKPPRALSKSLTWTLYDM